MRAGAGKLVDPERTNCLKRGLSDGSSVGARIGIDIGSLIPLPLSTCAQSAVRGLVATGRALQSKLQQQLPRIGVNDMPEARRPCQDYGDPARLVVRGNLDVAASGNYGADDLLNVGLMFGDLDQYVPGSVQNWSIGLGFEQRAHRHKCP